MGTPPASHPVDSRLRWLFKVGGAAGLLSGLGLLMAAISLVATLLQPGTAIGGLSFLASLWLIIIFKLHSGFGGIGMGLLTGMNLLDLGILALVAMMQLGLYGVLRRISRLWAVVAAIQPLLGIALFLATENAGRSALMGSVLVASLVMLHGGIVRKAVAYLGIAGSLLLLAGDFTAGVVPPSTLIAALFGVGYGLLTTWCFILGRWLWGRQP